MHRLFAVSLLVSVSGTALAAPVGPIDIAPTCTPDGTPAADRKCNNVHRVWVPGTPVASWEDRLVVILPGTNMDPDKHDALAQMAAGAGFRTIVLSYDNRQEHALGPQFTVGSFCADHHWGDRDCPGDVSRTVLWGPSAEPAPAGLTYNDEDSVEYRLIKVLKSLHDMDMLNGVNDYDWLHYKEEIDIHDSWCDIIVAGFSQGSQHASVLASDVDLGAAFFIDGASGRVPVGPVGAGWWMPANWRTGPHATDGAALFGVRHTTKTPSPEPAWTDLGMPVSAAGTHLIATGAPATSFLPAGEHRLKTDQTPPAGCSAHESMAKDGCFETGAGGKPLVTDAYRDVFAEAALALDPDCAP